MTVTNLEKSRAPSQRSQAPLLHRRRPDLRLPDPEPPLRRVLRQGRPRPARRRRDRRLRARSLAARAGLPVRCRRARGVFAASQLNPFMALGPKVVVAARGRGSASCCGTIIRSCATTRSCASARWCRWPMSSCICRSRLPATPISIRRRSTPPMSASCSAARTMRCSRTGCTCRSATTAAPRPSSSAARKVRRPRGQLKPPSGRCAELRAVQAARFRTRDGRGGRPAVGDGRDAHREAGRGDDLRLCHPQRLERARHPAMGVCAARAVPGQGVRRPRSARGS